LDVDDYQDFSVAALHGLPRSRGMIS